MIIEDQGHALKIALQSAIRDIKLSLVRHNGIPQSGEEREAFIKISAKAIVLAAAVKLYKC